MLVVMAAGNDGRDLDHHPDWVAVGDVDELLVVATGDGAGRLAAGTNWGGASIDVVALGRDVSSQSLEDAPINVSGSSAAAAIVTGTAAARQSNDPGLSGAELAASVRRASTSAAVPL